MTCLKTISPATPASEHPPRPFFDLQARYFISDDSTPDELLGDTGLFLGSAIGVLDSLCDSYSPSTSPESNAFWGALYMLKQSKASLAAAQSELVRQGVIRG